MFKKRSLVQKVEILPESNGKSLPLRGQSTAFHLDSFVTWESLGIFWIIPKKNMENPSKHMRYGYDIIHFDLN